MGSPRLDRVDKRFVRGRQMEMEHKSHKRGSDDEIKGNTELIIYADTLSARDHSSSFRPIST